ncbi:MAG: hypothetical protein ACK4XJ_05745 [Fimbriimonadaceae bacterium]
MSVRFAVPSALLLAALAGCQSYAPEAEASAPSDPPAVAVITDSNFLFAGNRLTRRDLRFRLDNLDYERNNALRPDLSDPRLTATIALLQDTIARSGQVTRFSVVANGPGVRIVPDVELPETSNVKTVDLVIVGGEIESLTTALAAQKRGLSVAVIYAGPLGGLISDTGGNLRYFDGYDGTPRPAEQRELFRTALGMSDFVAVPTGVSAKLAKHLRAKYTGKIAVHPIESYDLLKFTVDAQRVRAVTLPDGLTYEARWFIDAEPEARSAEKVGLDYSTVTPNLSYGMVFDLTGITKADLQRLAEHSRFTPDRIMQRAGVTAAQVAADPVASKALEKFRRDISRSWTKSHATHSYGYRAVAGGFGFYMHCLALNNPSKDLAFLNRARRTSGFNISWAGGVYNFNSISYTFDFNLMQHDHTLARSRLRPITEVDGPELESYLRWVTGNNRLKLRLPTQFYVRKANAVFETPHPYTRSDFVSRSQVSGPYWMTYPMDYRDIAPRNAREWEQFETLFWQSPGQPYWMCRTSVTYTRLENFYLLNKSMLPPRYMGGTRILQNFINTGVALAEELARKKRA